MRLSYDISLHSVCFCIQHSLNSTGQLKVQHTDAHGYQIWPQSGSDWPQMGKIREIFRSDSVHFGAPRQKVLNLI